MRHALKLLSGVMLGTGVMYLLDQQRGAHRRASLMQERGHSPRVSRRGRLGAHWPGMGRAAASSPGFL
jgi:hypothetical protein